MVYYINKITEKIEKRKKPNNAYKNLSFDSLKDCSLFKEYIYKNYYDGLNMKKYVPSVKKELELIQQRNLLLDKINEREEQLKVFDVYSNGFTESLEWKERIRLDNLYQNKIKEWNLLLVSIKELIQQDVIRRYPNRIEINKTQLSSAIFSNMFIGRYRSDNIKNLAKEFHIRAKPIEKELLNIRIEYDKLNKATYIENEEYRLIKEFLLNDLVKLDKINKELKKVGTENYYNCDGRKYIKTCKMRNLQLSDLKYSDEVGYNILVKKRRKFLNVLMIGEMNGRIAILDEKLNLLLNNDEIYIDLRYEGDPIKLNNLTFLNQNEPNFK